MSMSKLNNAFMIISTCVMLLFVTVLLGFMASLTLAGAYGGVLVAYFLYCSLIRKTGRVKFVPRNKTILTKVYPYVIGITATLVLCYLCRQESEKYGYFDKG